VRFSFFFGGGASERASMGFGVWPWNEWDRLWNGSVVLFWVILEVMGYFEGEIYPARRRVPVPPLTDPYMIQGFGSWLLLLT
jgi:hypothetical protein